MEHALAEYGIADLGVAGMMTAGHDSGELIAMIGRYITPAVADIGVAGLMVAGIDEPSANYRMLTRGTLKITDTQGDVSTCSFGIRCVADERPEKGDPVVIALGTLEDPIFAGYITSVGEGKAAVGKYDYDCQARSLARDLEKRILSAYDFAQFGLPTVWRNVYAGDVLKSLLGAYTPQFFDGGHLEEGVFLSEFSPLGKTLFDTGNDLASRSRFVFYIAPTREIIFQRRTVQTAAWQLEHPEDFGGLHVKDLDSPIKNRISVYYSKLESRTEGFTGDGERKVFALERKPYDVQGLTVNGVAVTYGTRYMENNSEHDFSVNYNEGELHAQAYGVPGAGDEIQIEYTAALPALLVANHAASQLAHRDRDGGDGIYDFEICAENEIFSLADAQSRADAELEQYAWPQVAASYDRREYLYAFQSARIRVGQQQHVRVRNRDTTLMVERVTISVAIPASGPTLKFLQHVELGPVSKGLKSLFREMQSAPERILPEVITTQEV